MKGKVKLSTQDLSVGYHRRRNSKTILSTLNLEAHSGQLICLIGANGSGKSTLLRTLACLQPLMKGKIFINSKSVQDLTMREIARQVSLVLTEQVHAGYLSVSDLVAMGRHPHTNWQGHLRKTDRELVATAIETTGLTHLSQTLLEELSDGQKQKAMIARALAQDGDLLLLDEPLIHLDVTAKWEIMTLLRYASHSQQKAIVMATHELDLCLRMADQLWIIGKNGKLHIGAPEDLVLSGAITEAFDHGEYYFDRETGGFALTTSGTPIQLQGKGATWFWTQRALERAGYQPGSGPGNGKVLIESGNANNSWIFQIGNKSITCISLAELIDSMDRVFKKSNHA